MKDAKRTILLTTHYIEEAERLCDRVAIVDEGKIIALGTRARSRNATWASRVSRFVPHRPCPVEVPQFQESAKHIISDDRLLLTVYSTRPRAHAARS
jgi:ABC-2 type transport system ATP-binding protein